jgi:secondary thiamine-phosphate synthase enzyme
MIKQRSIELPRMTRGVHLITHLISPAVAAVKTGIAHLFLQHSSASLALNENYDPDVRQDVESFLRTLVPDGWKGFRHTLEGRDDMPAHMKNILIGSALSIPITDGKLNLGTWQGIYLLEHREYAERRKIVITLIGE